VVRFGLTPASVPLFYEKESASENMSARLTECIFGVATIGWTIFSSPGPVYAQSAPALELQVTNGVAQLSITGDVGSPCVIEYATNLSAGSSWLTLSNYTLLSTPGLVIDFSGAADGQRFFRVVIEPPTDVAWIEAGTFVMGSPTNEAARGPNDETQHTVTLTRGFYIAKYLVTQGAYLSLLNTNPSYFTSSNGFTTDLTLPVEQVSWNDASNYCAQLTRQEQAAGHIFSNWTYRLPTESEWEYACRAGTTTPFYYGSNLLSGMANFDGEYEYIGGFGTTNYPQGTYVDRTTSVGSYQANAFGLYDLAANTWEWCHDWYAVYSTNTVIDPQGPATGSQRIFRGGAFNSYGKECRSAMRDSYNPEFGFNTVGFRVVLAAGP